MPDTAHTLRAEGFDASEDGTGRGTPLVVAVALRGREGGATAEVGDDLAFTLRASEGGGDKPHVLVRGVIPYDLFQVTAPINRQNRDETSPCHTLARDNAAHAAVVQAVPAMQVRRLTPRECERLQGFPDDYTLIPWRKKPASECPDGPRYKALGNSMAVPVMRWIGERIARQVQQPAHVIPRGR